MMVVCVSNAANLFHAYRRQMRRDYRKPLINLMSKKLLKLKEASSPIT
jgi:2-oxoglutarate dehydrogenase E1 component